MTFNGSSRKNNIFFFFFSYFHRHLHLFFLSGYGAVGLDSNPSYGHTPSHHTPQLSSLSFKHEDTLSPPNSIGKCLRRDVSSPDWKTVVSHHQGYIRSNPSFLRSQTPSLIPTFIQVSPFLAHINTVSLNDFGNHNLKRITFLSLCWNVRNCLGSSILYEPENYHSFSSNFLKRGDVQAI